MDCLKEKTVQNGFRGMYVESGILEQMQFHGWSEQCVITYLVLKSGVIGKSE